MSFSASEIAQLFARPEAELRERLAHTEDADLAGVCRVRGVTVGATREETLETLVASKVTDIPEQAQDSKSKPVVARKAPRAGPKWTGIGTKLKSKSATGLDKVRKLAEGPGPVTATPESSQPRWATRLLASPHRAGDLPSLPEFTAATDQVGAGANPLLQAPLDAAGQGSNQLPPAPSGVSSEVWGAMGAMFDVKLASVQQNLVQLNSAVTELQTHAVHRAELATTNAHVQHLAESVTEVSRAAVFNDDRVGKLESALEDLRKRFEKLELKAKRGPDDSFKRIVFLGLPDLSYEKRVTHMTKFMKDKFPDLKCACSVYFRKSDSKNERIMTNTGFAEFVSSDVRDHVVKQIEGNVSKFKFAIDGTEVPVRRARTRRATERNAALRSAADALKKLCEMDDDVVIVWGRGGEQRGIKVKEAYAFTQPSGDDLGQFTGEFEHLEL